MSIKSNVRREKDNEAKVVLKNLRISPQKLNLVLGMIRKQKADVAVSKLQFSKKRISKEVEKEPSLKTKKITAIRIFFKFSKIFFILLNRLNNFFNFI